jgi:hypothetical protein
MREETVWKIRMGSALRSQESQKPGERHPYRRLVLPKARDPSPSSYFPNSFGREILGSSYAVSCITTPLSRRRTAYLPPGRVKASAGPMRLSCNTWRRAYTLQEYPGGGMDPTYDLRLFKFPEIRCAVPTTSRHTTGGLEAAPIGGQLFAQGNS